MGNILTYIFSGSVDLQLEFLWEKLTKIVHWIGVHPSMVCHLLVNTQYIRLSFKQQINQN